MGPLCGPGSKGSEGSACLWQAGSKGKVLKMDGPSAQGFLSLTAFQAEGCGLPLCGNPYKVSVTRFTFSVIWQNKHSADWLAAPAGRLYGFRRQRQYKKWRRRRRTSPAQRYYITPEGGALNPPVRRSRSQVEPLAPRAERPGGAINPRGEAASTFGNTGKHRPGPIPHPPKFQIPIHLKKEGKFYASKNSTQNH